MVEWRNNCGAAEESKGAHCFQQVQCLLIDTALFEIGLGSIANLVDDLAVDLALHRISSSAMV